MSQHALRFDERTICTVGIVVGADAAAAPQVIKSDITALSSAHVAGSVTGSRQKKEESSGFFNGIKALVSKKKRRFVDAEFNLVCLDTGHAIFVYSVAERCAKRFALLCVSLS